MSYGNYPDLRSVKRILVVKHRHLGDVLLTGPVFSSLKRSLPQAQIDAYIYAESIPMLEGHPAVSQIIGYDRRWKKKPLFQRLAQEWRMLRLIRQNRYDLVINLTEGDRGALIAKFSGASIRVGFEPKGRWQKKTFTHIVKHCPSLRHTVERNLDAVRRIGIFPFPDDKELHFHIPQHAKNGVRQNEPYILIHPTSRWRFKCWPVEKMRSLVAYLIENGKKVHLSSGPDPIERDMVQAIGAGFDIVDWGGKLSLKELGALIEGSELLICVDSVPFHIASALKKQVVALFGPTSDITWGPWRNPNACIVSQNFSCRPCYQDGCGGSKHSECLHSLSLNAVLQAIDSFAAV